MSKHSNHASPLGPSIVRKLIQVSYALFCLYIGWQFYRFYLWTMDLGPYVPRPAAVEAFLPIGALVSLKRLVLTGHWDTIHPAGLSFFIGVLAASFLFRRGFCAYVCPIGLINDGLAWLGKVARVRLKPPRFMHLGLLSLKYIILAFFVWSVLVKMDLSSINAFMMSPYNLTVDARMLLFFLHPSTTSLVVIGVIMVLCIIFKHYWCTYLCPYGALLGIFSIFSPVLIKREEGKCKHCKKCQDSCPSSIRVWEKETVRVPECIGCLECLDSCPEKDCLSLTFWNRKRLPWWVMPLGVVGVMLLTWILANFTGHWHSMIPDERLKVIYKAFLS